MRGGNKVIGAHARFKEGLMADFDIKEVEDELKETSEVLLLSRLFLLWIT